MQVYDYVDGVYYFSDLIGPDVDGSPLAEGTAGVWPFVNGPHQWTPGTHKFFGWLVHDANGTETVTTDDLTPAGLFGNTFNYVTGEDKNVTIPAFADGVLTIPQTSMTQTSPQFDFMYSNIYMTEPTNTPVPLEFSHLFSAFCIAGENRQEDTKYDIKRITLEGLNNTQKASIDFSGETPVVTYTDLTTEKYTFDFDLSSTDTTIGSGEQKVLTGTYLMWPQNIEYFTDVKLTLYYDYVSGGSTTTAEPKEIYLSSMPAWSPGQVKILNLVFNVDQITFRIEDLIPWNTEEKDIPVQM